MRTLQIPLSGCFLASLAVFLLHADAAQAAKRDDAARRANRAHSSQQVVCGMTGCFNVPPGCQGETRRTGHGIVAVVNCRR